MNISMDTPPAQPAMRGKAAKIPNYSIQDLGRTIVVSIIILTCSMAVFLLGPNYSILFSTNGNTIYAASVSVVFLVAAMLFKRTEKFAKYWPVAYAFFVASVVNLFADLFGAYQSNIVQWLGFASGSNPAMGFSKLYETLLAVIPIIVLTMLAGGSLKSLYLTKGNLNYKWGFGIGALFVVNYLTSTLMFFGTDYQISRLGGVILWGVVFAFCNSLLEELWVRGLFMKKLLPLVGVVGTVILTSIWFGAMHFLSVAFMPTFAVPIFVVNALTMGIACAILILKTESIWGAYLLHAAADLFLFIAIMAAH